MGRRRSCERENPPFRACFSVIYHIVYIPVIYRLNMDEQKTTTKTPEEWLKERRDYERAERRAVERATAIVNKKVA